MAQTPRTRDKRLVDESAPLSELEVLIVDCQSTGASPKHGDLLEVAWCATRADEQPNATTSRVVALPDEEQIPPRIQRMTGISDDELSQATPLDVVWGELREAAAELGAGPDAPSIIHYARFERSFLTDAHERICPDASFPLDIICTHAIAQRLFPELPRRGLRALAGFLGHTVPEAKRAGHHVDATAAIWRHTVRELDIEWGVQTLGQLREWLDTREPTRRGGKRYALPRETRLGMPDVPGVYRMLSKAGDVLYVGKATSLKSRVNSYFQTRRGLSNTKLELVTQVWDVDITECDSPLEAALLEADEIKHHSPTYNTALRRRGRSLCWGNREWTSFSTTRDAEHPVGPLTDPARMQLVATLRRGEFEGIPDEMLAYIGETREMLAGGIEALKDEYDIDLGDPTTPLRRLALERWRERYEEKLAEAQRDEELDAEEPDEAPAEREWTPELVAKQLERTIRWCYRSLRLTRWLRLLADSSVRWTRAARPRSIILSGGQLVDEAPGGDARLERLDFDLATWDRLRVLNTELRRLVTDECAPEVELRGLRTLGTDQLARLFRWI